MIETQLTVRSEQGLHGRPADLFVRTANKFNSNLTVRNVTSNSGPVSAKSILKVLSLGVYNGHVIHIMADGEDEKKAIRALTRLVKSGFRHQFKTKTE
jgi:phosphotransferase system HPr (HPr) family protein